MSRESLVRSQDLEVNVAPSVRSLTAPIKRPTDSWQVVPSDRCRSYDANVF
jgi:hypothetical protein